MQPGDTVSRSLDGEQRNPGYRLKPPIFRLPASPPRIPLRSIRATRWLVHPTDRVLTVYRLAQGAYGRPEVQPLTGETQVAAIPGLFVAWLEPSA